MQTSILLPLILMASTGSDEGADPVASAREEAALTEIFRGCRNPVLDTTEASKILFDDQVSKMSASSGQLSDAPDDPIFIARCGEQFVLFNRNADGDAVYLRFQDRTYELVERHWG